MQDNKAGQQARVHEQSNSKNNESATQQGKNIANNHAGRESWIPIDCCKDLKTELTDNS